MPGPLAIVCLCVLALTAPAHADALRVTAPVDGERVALRPFLTVAQGTVSVRGRAVRGHVVAVHAPCLAGRCEARALVDRGGRFALTLDVLARPSVRRLPVTVTDLGAPRRRPLTRTLALTAPRATGQTPRLGVIGDSLAVGAAGPQPAALEGWDVTTFARGGRALAEGMRLFELVPLPARGPFAIAFSLFTNDDPRNLAGLETAVRRSVARLGRRGCAVWSTIARPPLAGRGYAAANRLLRALAAEPGLAGRLQIADWSRAYARRRSWRARDRVHATAQGYAGRAALVADAVRRCAA